MTTNTGDPILDGQYPQDWSEYVGQESAKRELKIAAKSAKVRGRNLDHLIISSPYAGIGKTALALLTVRAADRRVLVVTGSMKISDVRLMFTKVEDGDIIFYDEIHKSVEGGKKNAEWMLHYLENKVLMTPFGPEVVPDVTIIGATTDLGALPEPIQQRFKLIQLTQYSDAEGTLIARQLGGKILGVEGLPNLSGETAADVAMAAFNQPRAMRSLLMSLRDLAVCEEIPTPDDGKYDLEEALAFAGLTRDGLTPEAQQYLIIMVKELRAEPAGAALMKERMGLVGNALALVERLLLDKGFILKTKQGRVLSSQGMKRAVELAG
jgi:Holliday junction DNA helicase RuvB